MRTKIIFIALMALGHADQDHSVVRFANGDKLTGKLLSLTTESIEWQSELLKEPADFNLKHILDVGMPARMGADDGTQGEHEAILELTNGDVIKGMLAGLSDNEITLNTWYASKLVVRRVNVKDVRITRTSEILYTGPKDTEGWKFSDGDVGWKFKAGALVVKSAGRISREIDFSDECKIIFDAAWRGAFRPRLIFFSDDPESGSPSGGYEMVFQGNSAHVKRAGSNEWLGHTSDAGVLREQESARIEIRASMKTGKILLFVDDKFIHMWEDPDFKSNTIGKGFHLISQDNTPLRISNIVVSKWDGFVDDVPKKRNNARIDPFQRRWEVDPEEENAEKEEDKNDGRMVLVNGDSIQGEVMGIEGEIITVKTPLSEVKFPVHRLKNIVLKPAELETVKRYKGDVRATLSDGSKLVFRLDEVRDGKLIGFSQNYGPAEFSEEAFRRIEFNIHITALNEMRRAEEW